FLIPCVDFALSLVGSAFEDFSMPAPDWARHVARTVDDFSRSDLGEFVLSAPPKAAEAPLPSSSRLAEPVGPTRLNPLPETIDVYEIAHDCVARRSPFVCIDDSLRDQPDGIRVKGYAALAQ